MRKFSIILATAIIILIAFAGTATCMAQTFTVPLPQVTGNYLAGNTKSFSFDLGTSLMQINSVNFVCSGTVTAGLDYNFQPFSWRFNAYLNANPYYMVAKTPSAGASTYPNPEPFASQTAFSPLLPANWNFLLDGSATGWVELSQVISVPEFPPMANPRGYVNSASLIIDAVVPEPATLLLLSLGAVMLRKRK